MAADQSHKHHLESMFNLIASLQDPSESDPGPSGANHGQFKDNFGKLILSSLPEQQGENSPSSSYLDALSALSTDTGLGGIWLQDELPAAFDDLQRKIVLYHLANLELFLPVDHTSAELQQRHWDNLLQNNQRLIPTDTFTYQDLTEPGEIHDRSVGLTEAARLHGPTITRELAKLCRSFHPGLVERRQSPANPLIFHCQDDITSARETHPVTVLSLIHI